MAHGPAKNSMKQNLYLIPTAFRATLTDPVNLARPVKIRPIYGYKPRERSSGARIRPGPVKKFTGRANAGRSTCTNSVPAAGYGFQSATLRRSRNPNAAAATAHPLTSGEQSRELQPESTPPATKCRSASAHPASEEAAAAVVGEAAGQLRPARPRAPPTRRRGRSSCGASARSGGRRGSGPTAVCAPRRRWRPTRRAPPRPLPPAPSFPPPVRGARPPHRHRRRRVHVAVAAAMTKRSGSSALRSPPPSRRQRPASDASGRRWRPPLPR